MKPEIDRIRHRQQQIKEELVKTTVYVERNDEGTYIAQGFGMTTRGDDAAAALVALANQLRCGQVSKCKCGISVLTWFEEEKCIPEQPHHEGELLLHHYCFPDEPPVCLDRKGIEWE